MVMVAELAQNPTATVRPTATASLKTAVENFKAFTFCLQRVKSRLYYHNTVAHALLRDILSRASNGAVLRRRSDYRSKTALLLARLRMLTLDPHTCHSTHVTPLRFTLRPGQSIFD